MFPCLAPYSALQGSISVRSTAAGGGPQKPFRSGVIPRLRPYFPPSAAPLSWATQSHRRET
ncbi:hypothetical protein NDK47_09950 [Brevibacillus ruminantium]|uniref:Uncharacterized protein n=1 Tax=Brevibacillus ruminantium TaxID=2950604 RepID=A0ABY4WL37_9BACL|nr:hypothetical protein [Brevibacillus ruminantium]USG67569.1 hypothetical protein NDK47_09950 [Brevibacillus ruminantium]